MLNYYGTKFSPSYHIISQRESIKNTHYIYRNDFTVHKSYIYIKKIDGKFKKKSERLRLNV